MAEINVVNSISVRLELTANDNTISWGTGFFVAKDGVQFLATNKHVLSGKNPITGDLMSPSTGAIPDRVYVYYHVHNEMGTTWYRKPYDLNMEGEPVWVSPFDDPETDIAFLAAPYPEVNPVVTPLGRDSTLADIQEEAGMRVVILGFPESMTKKTFFPVWKTGYIATEPLVNYDEQALFLVDSYTAPGMSGSPVILVTNGGYKTKAGVTVLTTVTQYKFLGIYSGRISKDSTLARVWKAETLLEGIDRLYIQP